MQKEPNIIGVEFSSLGNDTFYSYNPATGTNNDYLFHKATEAEIESAAKKAAAAFQTYRKKTGKEKAAFLSAIADKISNTGEALITICCAETALPPARIEGERARTVNQLKMFAALLLEGSWVDARIDTAMPDRTPLAKPDLRSIHIPIGPVVVFGASNFPLAFSVAGGDMASALAAGCTVIVKAHPAHPATSAIIGRAIQAAAIETGMPDGVFSLLFDNGISVGQQLVKHPLIKAVGFTGSYKAGKAIFDAAAARPEPIPVYAEMSSVNPVFILPQMMHSKGKEIAAAYSLSLTMGVGQFCTNPGVLFYQSENGGFKESLKTALEQTKAGVMLTKTILDSYNAGVNERLAMAGVSKFAMGDESTAGNNLATPILMEVDNQSFDTAPTLKEEVFGPAGVVVSMATKKEMMEAAMTMFGQLTATVHGTDEELIEYADLLDILEQKAGRVVINGFPTGVEVSHAMVHGGPFPATTDSKTTSVGTAAIYRFTRPVCYQNMPQSLLPEELKNENSLKIFRMINGEITDKDIVQ